MSRRSALAPAKQYELRNSFTNDKCPYRVASTMETPEESTVPKRAILPVDIILCILEAVVELNLEPKQRHLLATVCRDWQHFFEKRHFSNLSLNSYERVIELGNIVTGHRVPFVRKIHLHVALNPYDCTRCSVKEDRDEIRSNNHLFTESVTALFRTLSKWEPKTGKTGLELDLSADSRSDRFHWYPRFATDADQLEYDANHGAVQPTVNDEENTWNATAMPLGALSRWVGRLLEFEQTTKHGLSHMAVNLEAVPAIKRFSLLRSSFRSLGPVAMAKMLRSMTQLEAFRFTPRWPSDREDVNRCLATHEAILDNLPPTVTVLVHSIWNSSSIPDDVWKPLEDLVLSVIEMSRQLRVFSTFGIVDGSAFLRYFDKGGSIPTWPHLEVLALVLDPCRDYQHHEADSTLAAAARVVAQMPRVKTFEVWSANSRVDHLLVFRYEVLEKETRLTIKTSDEFKMSEKTRKAWSMVARSRTRHELKEVVTQIKFADGPRCYLSDITPHLVLKPLYPACLMRNTD